MRFVRDCQNKDGGFGGSVNYPSTVLSTFNALQILYLLQHPLDLTKTKAFITDLINEDGSIYNDKYKETDVRILCCGVLSLQLIDLLSKGDFDRRKLSKRIPEDLLPDTKRFNLTNFIMKCYNNDGGFGNIPGGESHNAHTFCCLSSLRALGALEAFGTTDIARYITLKQKVNGGLSGRVSKKEDVCYSFWAYSSMVMIGREGMVNQERLKEFILSCQSQNGGFSDRPGNEPDLYHLMFSLAGLSLMGFEGLEAVDPGYCV